MGESAYSRLASPSSDELPVDSVRPHVPEHAAGPPATGDTTVERTASAGGSLVADLERLAAMHRAGDLTAVEFDRAKARLLEAAS